MKDEIKEIISYLKNNTFIPDETKRKYKILHRDEVNKLLDYITNLQQRSVDIGEYNTLVNKYNEIYKENERLKDIVVEKDNQIKEMILQKTDYTAVNILEMKLEDYKSRCEKASEYINTHKVSDTITFPLMKREQENQVKSCFDYEFEQAYKKDLLNILQNGKNKGRQ